MPEEKGNSPVQLKSVQTQRAIPLDSPLEWKQALTGIRHSFFHTWEHCYAMYLTTKQPTFLYCAEGSGVRVVCPFVERSYGDVVDIATPYGFSGFAGNSAFPNLPGIWNQFAVERGYVTGYINLHPLFTRLDYLNQESVYKQKTLYVMDLTRSEAELLGNCSRTRRKELHRWERLATVVSDREELTSFLLENYPAFCHRKNASSAYDFKPETMEFLLGLENVLILGAGTQSRLEAVCVVPYTQHVAEGLFNFALPGCQWHGVGLIWEAARHLQRIGIPAFNLGGGIQPHDSLEFFKSRFGVEQFPLYSSKEVFDSDAYLGLCLLSGVDPGDHSGYFPGYRSSN